MLLIDDAAIAVLESRRWTVNESARLLGARRPTCKKKWIRAEILPAESRQRADGAGREWVLNFGQLVACGLVWSMRRQGHPLPLVRMIAVFVGGLSAAEIAIAAQENKILAASDGESVPPQLMAQGELVANRSGFSELLFHHPARNLFQRTVAGIEIIDRQTAQAN